MDGDQSKYGILASNKDHEMRNDEQCIQIVVQKRYSVRKVEEASTRKFYYYRGPQPSYSVFAVGR